MRSENAAALIVGVSPLFKDHRHQVAELAMRQRLPSIAFWREYAEVGGLMSYGRDSMESHRRAATYVDKIFKGANPADLPIEQPRRMELFINRRAAKALGLTIPQSLLISADRVIE